MSAIKSVLVSGANGFMARALIRYLQRTAPNVQLAGLLRDPATQEPLEAIRIAAGIEPVDLLVDLAGGGGIPECEADPAGAFESIVRGTISTLDAAREAEVGQVIVASTCAVYPLSPLGASENDPLALRTVYAKAKRAAEVYGITAYQLTGQDVRVIRPANIFGPGQGRQLIFEVARRAIADGRVELRSSGQERRDFLAAEDAAAAIWTVAQRGAAGEIYNLGSGQPKRVLDVAQAICDSFSAKLQVPQPDAVQYQDGSADAFQNVTKLENLGFRPAASLQERLTETLDWIKEQDDLGG